MGAGLRRLAGRRHSESREKDGRQSGLSGTHILIEDNVRTKRSYAPSFPNYVLGLYNNRCKRQIREMANGIEVKASHTMIMLLCNQTVVSSRVNMTSLLHTQVAGLE